ncbi:MAG TPA: hypothetical protein DCP69_08555 [Candidatus Omnitrophica bacterium]|nr:hypothetical protein [Candidatus Omnitrophota bacterium]
MRIVSGSFERLLQSVGVHHPPHRPSRPFKELPRPLALLLGGGPMRDGLEDLAAPRRSDLDEEHVAIRLAQFRQRQIKPGGGGWPRLHGHAETRPAGLPALHADDEQVTASGLIDRIAEGTLEKDATLNRQGVQLAGAHPDHGVSGRSVV